MNNFRILGVLLLLGGLALLFLGLNASDSLSADVSRAIDGSPSDRTLWYLIGGGLLALAGLGALVRRTPSRIPR